MRAGFERRAFSTSAHLFRCLVNEPLAFRSLDSRYSSFSVAHLALIPSEGKLIAVTVKAGLGDMMECAVDPALEQSEERLHRVRVDLASGILALTVVDCLTEWCPRKSLPKDPRICACPLCCPTAGLRPNRRFVAGSPVSRVSPAEFPTGTGRRRHRPPPSGSGTPPLRALPATPARQSRFRWAHG